MRLRRRFIPLVACLLAIAIPSASMLAATPQEIQAAIEKGKAYLYSMQIEGTRWERDAQRVGNTHDYWTVPQGSEWGGWTALCTYALLASGESPQDPRLVKSISFLKTADIIGTYSVSVRANVWTLIPQTDEVRKMEKHDAAMLFNGINKTDTPQRGLYHYLTEGAGIWHNSTSQYGALGVWALEHAGIEVPRKYWEMVDTAWRKNQQPDGGWTYHVPCAPGQGSTLPMTAAGIATLFITQDALHSNDGLACKGNFADPVVERGLKWIIDHYGADWPLYDLYGLERIGVASGHKYFGTKDWYAIGAEYLVRTQQTNGSWIQSTFGGLPVTNAAFALLFLSRGRAPVVMNKLQYDVEPGKLGNWNQRPRDIANLASWTGKQVERDLNWQIVNLDVPIEDMHDSPILYISGDQTLKFSPDQKKKLKAFVEGGGLILGNSDCGSLGFTSSFKKLGTELFPTYEFRDLPKNHLIFTGEMFKIKAKPFLLGLSNGSREMMLLLPNADASRAWQTRAKPNLLQLGADIFLYAVDKQNLRYKSETHLIKTELTARPDRTIKVARLEYAGNWDPEPGGWRRMAIHLLNTRHLEVAVTPVKLGTNSLAGYTVAHLTGTAGFKLSDPERDELTKFVKQGGTLIVDSAGGNSEFALAAETELEIMLGGAKGLKMPLDPTHPLYTMATSPITEFGYREFARARLGNNRNPRICGLDINGRTAVFFSAEDLSTGIVGQAVDGINGYDPKTATAIMSNLLLYAAKETAAPATTKP